MPCAPGPSKAIVVSKAIPKSGLIPLCRKRWLAEVLLLSWNREVALNIVLQVSIASAFLSKWKTATRFINWFTIHTISHFDQFLRSRVTGSPMVIHLTHSSLDIPSLWKKSVVFKAGRVPLFGRIYVDRFTSHYALPILFSLNDHPLSSQSFLDQILPSVWKSSKSRFHICVTIIDLIPYGAAIMTLCVWISDTLFNGITFPRYSTFHFVTRGVTWSWRNPDSLFKTRSSGDFTDLLSEEGTLRDILMCDLKIGGMIRWIF